MLSKFSLSNGRYLLHEENLVCTVIDSRYSRPLQSKMEALESTKGTEFAMKVLGYMCSHPSLNEVLRAPTKIDHDVVDAHSAVDIPGKYGAKILCGKCHKKYYDLHGRITSCPICKRNA